MLKLQYSGHLMWRADSLEKTLMLGKIESKNEEGSRRRLDSITNSMDMNLSNLQETVEDREACPACRLYATYSPWHLKLDKTLVTEQQQ